MGGVEVHRVRSCIWGMTWYKESFLNQRGKIIMVNWNRFIPSDFEYDFERDKLAAHGVEFNEAWSVSSQILR